ncbi:MAG: phytoene/squalene synthase family protein, partial [Gammaproteobacteria bacterium]|nr:phytoene/squalene synthase family protein [Gammaproteobacteria bacterium]
MNEGTVTSFIDKWRSRWPEWRIAEVFVPAGQRSVAEAWFTLLQELYESAWGGS